MPHFIPFVTLAAALAAPAVGFAEAAPEDGFCIVNASAVPHIFTTETREGVRQVAELAPGDSLCAASTEAADGVIGVFEHIDALEGCARIVPRGGTEELLEYAEFDRCHWGSHGS